MSQQTQHRGGYGRTGIPLRCAGRRGSGAGRTQGCCGRRKCQADVDAASAHRHCPTVSHSCGLNGSEMQLFFNFLQSFLPDVYVQRVYRRPERVEYCSVEWSPLCTTAASGSLLMASTSFLS